MTCRVRAAFPSTRAQDTPCDGCSGVGKLTISITRTGKVTYAACPDCAGTGRRSP